MDHVLSLLGPLQPSLPETPIVNRLTLALTLLIASEAHSLYLGSSLFKTLASLSFFFGGLGQAFGTSTTQDLATVWPLVKDFLDGKLQDNPYAFCMVAGLGFSVLGDVFLIPSRETYFGLTGEAKPAEQPQERAPETPVKGKKKAKKAAAAAVEAPAEATPEPPKKATGDDNNFKIGVACFALAHMAYAFGFISAPDAQDINYYKAGAAIFTSLILTRILGLTGPPKKNPWLKMTVPKDLVPLVKIYICVITTMVTIASGTDAGLQKTVGAWMFYLSDMFVAVDAFGPKPPVTKRRPYEGRPGWKWRSVGWVFYFWAQIVLAGCI